MTVDALEEQVRKIASVGVLKREFRAQRRQRRRARRKVWRSELRCWWTLPWRHEMVDGRCVGCGKSFSQSQREP